MGGSQYQVQCLTNFLLEKQKFQLFFLAKHFDQSYSPNGYSLLRISKHNEHSLWGKISDKYKLFGLLKEIGPDVIYQRVASFYTGLCAIYAAEHKCKMIWHNSSDADLLPNKMSLSKSFLDRYINRKMILKGICLASKIVVQTNQQNEYLKKFHRREADLVLPNFHPFPEEIANKEGSVRVLWIANLKPLKQPELFLELAKSLRSCTKNVRFQLVGKLQGNTRWKSKIEAKLKNIPNIDYLGSKTQREVNSLLASSHLLVNTSTHEGFSNTFIQAWMRKVPVVSLNVNPDNVFTKEEIGIHSGSFKQLLNDVRLLIEDRALREKMGNRACNYACRVHSMQNAYKLMDLIEN